MAHHKSVSSAPSKRLFFVGAAHLDRVGRLDESADFERSNPGSVKEWPGGAALNVASIVASLGANAELASINGKDVQGDQIAANMKQRGVGFHQQISAHHPTATYSAILQPDGELVIGLADMAIYDDFKIEGIADLLAGLADDDWLIVDANLPGAAFGPLLEATRANKAAISTSAAKAGRLTPHLQQLDVLLTNRAEAAALCGLENSTPTVDILSNLEQITPSRIVCSDGASPIWFVENGQRQSLSVPTQNDICDVTGAGDALAGACLYGLSCGWSLHDAVELGMRTAHLILAVDGPWRDDLHTVTKSADLNGKPVEK